MATVTGGRKQKHVKNRHYQARRRNQSHSHLREMWARNRRIGATGVTSTPRTYATSDADTLSTCAAGDVDALRIATTTTTITAASGAAPIGASS